MPSASWISRRRFLKLLAGVTLAPTVAGSGGYLYARLVEPDWVEVTSIRLKLPNLAPEFDGFRLAQISDIHMDGWMTQARLTEAVKMVNRESPDLVVVTGDFVTLNPVDRYAAELVPALKLLAPSEGTLGIFGNHDHWTNVGAVGRVMQDSGIINVSNGAHTLSRGKAHLHFAGVDDVWERKDRLDLVLRQLPGDGAAVLLAHEPDYADTSATTGRFDLQLSGHSHGGQVNLPFVGRPALPPFGKKYPAGRYLIRDMTLYTNRGLGMVSPKVRFNCRPEVTLLTLESR